MLGPDDALRNDIARMLSDLPPSDARGSNEADLAEELFTRIADAAARDVDGDSNGLLRLRSVAAGNEPSSDDSRTAAEEMLVVVNEWASLISYVSSAIYGPASPVNGHEKVPDFGHGKSQLVAMRSP